MSHYEIRRVELPLTGANTRPVRCWSVWRDGVYVELDARPATEVRDLLLRKRPGCTVAIDKTLRAFDPRNER